MSQALTPEKIMQTGFGFWASKTLLSAVELKVFTELAKGPMDVTALRKRIGIHERSARDFFDTLVAMGFLERKDGKYSNTPETDLFLDKAKSSYVGGILEMSNARLYPSWGKLTLALRTGESQSESQGFTDMYKNPDLMKLFTKAMTGISMGANKMMARKFPWEKYKTFVDVGTAEGGLPVQLALTHSHLTGVGVDLPEVKSVFEEYVASFQLDGRVKFHSCDILKEPLPPGDVYILGHILHGADLQGKKGMLKKIYEALPKGGAVIIFDAIIDDDRRQNVFGLLMSLNMLIETPAGFDYTGAEGISWLKETGFQEAHVEHLVGPDSMLIGIK